MSQEIRISAKDLGAMALEDFCPRCFWIKRKAKQVPWQIFPGIFSSIDAYTKNVVHAYIDRNGCLPGWMPENFDGVVGYLKAPHWSKFKWTDPGTGITVSGVVDDLLVTDNGDHCIPDYKTAKFTANADKLLQMYKVQLNGYAIIDESMGNNVQGLALIYCEPVTTPEACTEKIYHPDGFDMGFTAKVLTIERNRKMVLDLLEVAKEIIDGPIPDETPGCKDCQKLNNVIGVMIPEGKQAA